MKGLFKTLLRRIQSGIERDFARKRHLIPFGQYGLIRVELTSVREREVALPGGQVILKGTPIAEIHLDSERLMGLYEGGSPTVKTRIRIFREVKDSFTQIASWLSEDERGKQIQAFSSLTLLDEELKHFGFTLTPLPVWPWIVTGIYMHYLSFLYRTRGKKEPKRISGRKAEVDNSFRSGLLGGLLGRCVPARAWMSREEFLKQFSKATRSGENAERESLPASFRDPVG